MPYGLTSNLPRGNIASMTSFREYFLRLPREARAAFAQSCGVTEGFLTLVAYGHKRVSPKCALAIEAASGGAVKAGDLCPGLDRLLLEAGYVKEEP